MPNQPSRPSLDTALAFAGHGFGVFSVWGISEHGNCLCGQGERCTSPGKHPIPVNGLKAATTDPDAITRMLAAPGSAGNYGVFPAPNVIVLDVDKEGWREKLIALALPRTLGVETANGVHLYYRWPQDYGPQPTKLFGWVVRSQEHAGYVVGPGSTHVTGRTYQIARQNGHTDDEMLARIADFPKDRVPESGLKLVVSEGARLPESVPEGGRHDFLRDRARTLRGGGLTGEDLFRAVSALNARLPVPKSDEEVRRAIGDVETKFDEDPIRVGPAPVLLPDLAGIPQNDEALSSALRGLIYPIQALPSPVASEWLIEGLMKPKGLVVLAGEEGIGKSWVRVELAIRLATGQGALFDAYPVVGRQPVLLLDEENGEDIEYEREEFVLAALGLTRQDLGWNYARMSFGGTDLTTVEGRQAFEARIASAQPKVVIVDTGGDAVNAAEWGEKFLGVMRYVRTVSETKGIVIVFVVHLTKPDENSKEKAAREKGGRSLTSVMGHWGRKGDSIWLMSPADGGKAHFHVWKRWGESHHVLTRDNDLWRSVVAVKPTRISESNKAGLAVLGALKHGGPGTLASVGDWLNKSPDAPSRATIHRKLRALVAEGLASEADNTYTLTPAGETELVAQAKAGVTLIVPKL